MSEPDPDAGKPLTADRDRDLAATVDLLVAVDVINIDENDTVVLSDRFESAREEYRAEFESYQTEDLTGSFAPVADGNEVRQLANIGSDAPGFIAT